jgi:hypothetical protein
MIFRIPAGRHRARPFRFGIWWNRISFAWQLTFTESCRYDLKSDDQFDTNKLCGIGFIPGFHHKDSARFGWRYWPDKGWVELSAYCYVDSRRIIQHIGFCEIGKPYKIELKVLTSMYRFNCDEVNKYYLKSNGEAQVKRNHKKMFMYRLGTYFGGNRTAPQDITIQLS